jgi:uncharacterized protein (DUF362 family)/NAD-dependent dihydropyrimidine dehydrogenase PreA subunit
MKVVIEKCDRYEDAEKAVEDALKKLGGIERFIKEGEKVAIKPNLLQARKPEDAVTTNPEVVRAVIKQVKKITTNITITESPGIVGSLQGWENLIEKTGMKKIAEEEGVKTAMLKTPKKIERKGIVTNDLSIAEEIMGYDKVINVAKLKTHMLTVYTGCVKNMFGIIPGKIKSGMHVRFESPEKFSMMLLDLYMIKRAELNILDGIDGMEGDGPASGDKKHFGIIGISEDALALDYVVVNGLNMNVPMIKIAEKRKMIPEIELEGEIKGGIKNPGANMMERVLVSAVGSLRKKIASRPAVNKERCTKCANCYSICPVEAIKMNPHPEFDYEKCIRCYCCHEICPEKAVYLKKSLAQKILRR